MPVKFMALFRRYCLGQGRPRTAALSGVVLSLVVAFAFMSFPLGASAAPVGGHITGKVTNSGGTGIENIDVSAEAVSDGTWFDAWTITDGTYDIGDLPADTYRVEFYDEAGTYVDQYYNNVATLDAATGVAVTDGSTTAHIDATLALAGHITGKVTDSVGTGIDSTDVIVYVLSDGEWVDCQQFAQTDSDGTYDVGGLPTGTYHVQFDPGTRSSEYAGQYYNNAATFGASTGVAVTAGSTTANIDATLAPAGHITGRVTNPSGTGIQDIQVTVYDSSGDGTMDTWVNISTDELGNYDASGLPTGTYRVQFDDPDNGTYLGEFYNNATTFALAANVPVTAGTTIPNINATLAYIVAPSTPQTVWRFRNLRNGFYLWSADPSEKATIINTLSGTWFYEGPAYNINTSNPLNSSPLWRFRNIRGGFYLYTADPGEKATIINTLGGTWTYEGPAYNVSMSSSGAPVWRFRNLHDGTYLYSADPNEKNTIVATLGWTWFLEGVAYYIAP